MSPLNGTASPRENGIDKLQPKKEHIGPHRCVHKLLINVCRHLPPYRTVMFYYTMFFFFIGLLYAHVYVFEKKKQNIFRYLPSIFFTGIYKPSREIFYIVIMICERFINILFLLFLRTCFTKTDFRFTLLSKLIITTIITTT